jgi:hypothetical protein
MQMDKRRVHAVRVPSYLTKRVTMIFIIAAVQVSYVVRTDDERM